MKVRLKQLEKKMDEILFKKIGSFSCSHSKIQAVFFSLNEFYSYNLLFIFFSDLNH